MAYPVHLTIEYPQQLSRAMLIVRLFFGWAYVGIPHGICLAIYGMAAAIAMLIAWFAVLFTGVYPRGLFDFVVGLHRWQTRVSAYLTFMTDQYPPFSNVEEPPRPAAPVAS
jgi:hypothetical protein